ncbi:hypothetical protein KAR04_07355, partial [Candidatus Calescamantes bacterium]|nr:hypothetical protein [Candidatus Calescamantes bacterium]
NSTTSSVALAWDIAADSENTTEAIKYDLYRSESSPVDTSTATLVSSDGTALTYTDNTVSSGTTYYYKVVAKNCVPLEKTATDEIGVTVPTPSSLTIYDVQYTASVGTECYDSAYLGQVVTISGIVSATGTSRYILEEASGSWHGVLVYDSVNTPTRGDSVTITGTVDEYFGLTEMTTITSYTVNSTGNTVDSASTLTVEAYGGALPGISCGATQETYEGVLVTFYDVEVSSSTDASGRWRIKDQSGTNELDVDDRFYSASMTLGEQLDSVTGVILYEYDRYRLNPRDASDIVAATCDMGDVSAPVFGGGDSLIAVTDPGTGGALQITWNTATDPENPVLYAIYRSLTADFTPGAGTLIDTGLTTTSYDDSGLTNGLEYFYTVQAYNCAGLQTTNTDEDSGTPTLSGKDWTIAVFLNCDNNLEADGLDDFLEMSSVGSDANINIVVQMDRISGYSTAYGDWTSTKRFYITNGMTPDAANAVSDIGE